MSINLEKKPIKQKSIGDYRRFYLETDWLILVPICIIIISETVIGRNLQIESAFFGRGCSVHLKKEFLINNNEKD